MIGGSMNLKQQLPNFETIRDLGISCDGNNVTMTVTKVRIIFDQENKQLLIENLNDLISYII